MRAFWSAALLLRRLRTEPGVVLLVVVLVAGTSFLFSAAPRVFNSVSDEALRYEVGGAVPNQRNVQLEISSRWLGPPGPDPELTSARNFAAGQEEKFPASLQSLISGRWLLITSPRFEVTAKAVGDTPLLLPTRVAMRYQDGFTDNTRLTAGRWPTDLGSRMPAAIFGDPFSPPDPEEFEEPDPLPFEIALSSDTAADTGVAVGDVLSAQLDGSDALLNSLGGFLPLVAPLELNVVGIYEVTDPGADFWYRDQSLAGIFQAGSSEHPIAWATAYLPAASYAGLAASQLPFRYEWRYDVSADRLDAGQVDTLLADLHRMEIDFATGSSVIAQPGVVFMRSSLAALIEGYQAKQAASAAVLSIAAIAPFALAGGALGMTAILLVARRRATLALARGRGASGTLIVGTQLWEAVLLAGGAALAGLLLATTLISARASFLSTVLAVGVAATATLLLVGASWPAARRPLGQVERDDPPVLRVSPRRLVVELTVVGIAVAGALLLRERGVAVSGGELVTFDPLLAAVPVLSGVAVGIVAMRLYPLPVRGLGWLAARRRDLVPVLGLRTVGRHPSAANLPLLVLMLTAAFAAFASVVVSSVDRGQVTASWLNLGADYRVTMGGDRPLPVGFDPAGVDGVEAVAPGLLDPTALFASEPNQQSSIVFQAVDPAAYADVTAGSPADPAWPAAILEAPSGDDPGSEANPIPAILSRRLPVGSRALGVGDQFEVAVNGQPMTFRAVQERLSFPGIAPDAAFVVAPFGWTQEAFGNKPLRPTVMWVRGGEQVEEPLAANVREDAVAAQLESRHEAYRTLHEAPLVAVIGGGFGIAMVVAAIYTGLTIIGALALSAARRTQDLAFLRTLGVTRGQALWLTVVEHAPPVLLALVPGIALGIGVALLLEPGLGLSAFVGADLAVPLTVNWGGLAVVCGALLALVSVAVLAGTWLSRRARLVDALRIGDDW